jgi:hypothetical protein
VHDRLDRELDHLVVLGARDVGTWMIFAGTWRGVVFARIRVRIFSSSFSSSV